MDHEAGSLRNPCPGDRYADLVARYRAELRLLALRLTQSQQSADEVLEDVLRRLHIHRYRLAHVPNLRAWLYRVVYFRAAALMRPGSDSGGAAETCATQLHLRDLVALLAPADGAAGGADNATAAAPDLGALSLQEVAERFNITVPALRTALAQIRAELRERLAAFDPMNARLGRRRGHCPVRDSSASGYTRRRRHRNGDGHSRRPTETQRR